MLSGSPQPIHARQMKGFEDMRQDDQQQTSDADNLQERKQASCAWRT